MTNEHNLRRVPRVTGIMSLNTGSSMGELLVERCYGTAPHPLTWKASVSLLILTPQILVNP